MTDYIKRIQSALSPKLKVTRREIKDFMLSRDISLKTPNEEEVEAVKAHFLGSFSLNCKSLTEKEEVVSDDIENPEIHSMVSFKAEAMGIELTEEQIEIIASELDLKKHSFLETIGDIEKALIDYIDYQESEEAREVSSMFSRVTARMRAKNNSLYGQINDGIGNFKETLECLGSEQKKTKNRILMRLKVPVV